MTAELSNGGVPQETIEDVTLVAFSERGDRTYREGVGTINAERMEATVTADCPGFPASITAKTATPDCDDLLITIVRWTGTEAQKEKHVPDELTADGAVYDGTEVRKCDESLPPERLVDRSGTSTTDW